MRHPAASDRIAVGHAESRILPVPDPTDLAAEALAVAEDVLAVTAQTTGSA